MDNGNDQGAVRRRFVDRNVAALNQNTGCFTQFRPSATHLGMIRDQLELIKQTRQELVGGRLVVDRDIAPYIAQILLRTRGKAVAVSHGLRVRLSTP